VPQYELGFLRRLPYGDDGAGDEGEGEGEGEGAAGRGHSNACFNCGQTGHSFRDCGLPVDQARIRAAREALGPRRGDLDGSGRYHDDGDGGGRGSGAARAGAGAGAGGRASSAVPPLAGPAAIGKDIAPGRLSSALRAALGMAEDGSADAHALVFPPFAPLMRRFGQPPGYTDPPPGAGASAGALHPGESADGDLSSSFRLHAGYASNGPVSAFVSLFDGTYEASSSSTRTGALSSSSSASVGAGVHAASASRPSIGTAAPRLHLFSTAEEADAAQMEAEEAASERLARPLGLLQAPLSVPLRLTPALPACTCGRRPTVSFPWMQYEDDGGRIPCSLHGGAAGGSGGSGGSAEAPVTKRGRFGGEGEGEGTGTHDGEARSLAAMPSPGEVADEPMDMSA
jgi:hypothetical protein